LPFSAAAAPEGPAGRDDSAKSWEAFARDPAGLHCGTVHDRFGWHRDGYLGRLVQVNTWTATSGVGGRSPVSALAMTLRS